MSQGSIGIPTISFCLELLGKVIAFAQLEGRPGDFTRLRRRLDAIRRQVEADDVRLARFSLEHLLGCLELDRSIQVLAEVLLPEVRQRVLDALVRSPDISRDVRATLDVARSAAASAANSLQEVAAETAIYWAAQRRAETFVLQGPAGGECARGRP